MSLELIKRTAELVTAFVTRNEMAAKEIKPLLEEVYNTLSGFAAETSRQTSGKIPAGAILKTHEIPSSAPTNVPVFDDAADKETVRCLVCSKKFRTLKRHLIAKHGITQDQYRKQYGLKAKDLIAPGYSAMRANMAKEHNLGGNLRHSKSDRVSEE
ncbi:MAG: MucR family transcriptional regulator [Magnetococcales bacterium]|nr:MucR family transcriptional regulator [Magnetococcales bacterium]